jgi:16S rRNA (guanine527-N7)-methyltransferase
LIWDFGLRFGPALRTILKNVKPEIINSIKKYQIAFNLDLPDSAVERLADYYELIQEHNAILHLVAPCSPEEFAIRHILESLTLLDFLPENARFADVGAGAGLPSIPCLLVRDDLSAVLIESKIKKVKFLETVANKLSLSDRVQIINRQFEEAEQGPFSIVTCRALDKFTEKLPRLLKWAKKRELLLFAGNSLREALQKQNVHFSEKLMPLSEQRYLFRIN